MNEESDVTPSAESPKTGYDIYLEERKLLVDAIRETARTFDKAILTFGSAAFGFSIAFLREAAPHPSVGTLIWLALSWGAFVIALLAIMLSFLFSHQACTWAMDRTYEQLVKGRRSKINPWSRATKILNYATVGLLFCGILFWGLFVFDNLRLNRDHFMNDKSDKAPTEQHGYVPPAPPKPQPAQPVSGKPGSPKPNK